MQREDMSQQSNAEKKLQLHLKEKVGQNRSEIVTGKEMRLCILGFFDLLSAQFFKNKPKGRKTSWNCGQARNTTALSQQIQTDFE